VVAEIVKETKEIVAIEKETVIEIPKPKAKVVSKTTRRKIKKGADSKAIDVEGKDSEPTEKNKAAEEVNAVEAEIVEESPKATKKTKAVKSKEIEELPKSKKPLETEVVDKPSRPTKKSKVVEKEVVEQIFKPSKKVEAVEEQEVKQPFSKPAKKAIETEEAVEQAPIPEVELVGATAMETLPKIAKKSKPMVKKKIEKSSNSEQKNEVEVKKERQNVIDVEDVITKEKEVTNQEL
jgi:hypothetical protein